MNRFKITITDLETGNVEVQEETNCIIGAVITDDGKKARCLGITECNAFKLAHAIAGAREAIAELFAEHPELEQLVTIYELKKTLNTMKGVNEQNEDE